MIFWNRPKLKKSISSIRLLISRNQSLVNAEREKRFVTCPIYYASGKPHIGHLYSTLIGDFYHRWFKLNNKDSLLSVGTDEHGSKIVRNYHQNSFKYDDIQDFVDHISSFYRDEFNAINIDAENSVFIRTTDRLHQENCQKIWSKIEPKLTKSVHSGWYSFDAETFVHERDQIIIDGKRFAIGSKSILEYLEEEYYTFTFAEYLDKIEDYILNAVNCSSHVQESLIDHVRWLKNDPIRAKLSVSRPIARHSWGIPVPNDPQHVMYVWFDALINYLTSAQMSHQSKTSYWPPSVQIVGEEISRFHCVYFPAILLAAGYELPESVFVHGHWTVKGEKMGKSKANFVSLPEMAEIVDFQYDGIRWALLSATGHGSADYSNDMLKNVTLSRISNLLEISTDHNSNPLQIYPKFTLRHIPDDEIVFIIKSLPERFGRLVSDGKIEKALEITIEIIDRGHSIMERNRPETFDLSNSNDRAKLNTVIFTIYELLRVCAILLQPAIPESSNNILNRLGVPLHLRNIEHAESSFLSTSEYIGNELGPVSEILYRTESPKLKKLYENNNISIDSMEFKVS